MHRNPRLIFGALISLLLILALSIGYYLESQLQTWLKDKLINELAHNITTLNDSLTIIDPVFTEKSLDALIDDLSVGTIHRFTIISSKGKLLADSELSNHSLLTAENHQSRPELLSATSSKPGVITRYSSTLGLDMLYVASPYNIHGNIGHIRAAIPLIEIDNYINSLRSILITAFLIGIILLSLLIFFSFKYLQELNNDHKNDLIKVQKFSNLLSSCQDTGSFINVVSSTAESIYPNTSGAISILHPDTDQYDVITSWGDHWTGEDFFAADECWAFHEGFPHISNSNGLELKCSHLKSSFVTICVPLLGQNTILGALHLILETGLSADQKEELISKADHLSLALSNINLRETLKIQAIRDPLTNLFNRRYLEESFSSEILRANRQEYSIGIMMIDIDHFKKFNDSFGHSAGDYVLEQVASIMMKLLRGDDIACRYGGEEFVLIMPNSPLENVVSRANSILEEIRSAHFSFEGVNLGSVTISIGVALYPDHGGEKSIIDVADKALYKAKSSGRDQVIVTSDL